jgi:hypothetical protein
MIWQRIIGLLLALVFTSAVLLLLRLASVVIVFLVLLAFGVHWVVALFFALFPGSRLIEWIVLLLDLFVPARKRKQSVKTMEKS